MNTPVVVCSAGAQNVRKRTGRRHRMERLGNLHNKVDAAWREFWARRGVAAPPVPNAYLLKPQVVQWSRAEAINELRREA